MKKVFLAAAVFVIVFVCSYLAMCYLVPGFRIKLEADPFTYFVESLRSMMLFKTGVSLIAGAVAAAVSVQLPSLRR